VRVQVVEGKEIKETTLPSGARWPNLLPSRAAFTTRVNYCTVHAMDATRRAEVQTISHCAEGNVDGSANGNAYGDTDVDSNGSANGNAKVNTDRAGCTPGTSSARVSCWQFFGTSHS
jgi:hypothetical protein